MPLTPQRVKALVGLLKVDHLDVKNNWIISVIDGDDLSVDFWVNSRCCCIRVYTIDDVDFIWSVSSAENEVEKDVGSVRGDYDEFFIKVSLSLKKFIDNALALPPLSSLPAQLSCLLQRLDALT